MLPASPAPNPSTAYSTALSTDVFVVSEDAPGDWRVADCLNDRVSGPFTDQYGALSLAFEGVRRSSRWEIHVLDRFGTLMGTHNSEEGAIHVKVD